MIDLHRPPQTEIPDDLAPNRTGYSNDQLAIRSLAEVVSTLVMDSGKSTANQRRADAQRKRMLATLADVYALTEPS